MRTSDPYASDSILVPHGHVARGEVELPGSVSVTQRLLILAALASGTSTIEGAPACQDVEVLLTALRDLDIEIEGEPPGVLTVRGTGGAFRAGRREVDAGDDGTALRFLTALATVRSGATIVHGNSEIPVRGLMRALQYLGSWVLAATHGTAPPIRVDGHEIPAGGRVSPRLQLSSETVSALLLVGAFFEQGLVVDVADGSPSRWDVDLTVACLAAFGSRVGVGERGSYVVHPAGSSQDPVIGGDHSAEGDACSAAYYLAAAAVTSGRVRVLGLGRNSFQGEARVTEFLEQMGCAVEVGESFLEVRGGNLVGAELSLADFPQLVPPLAVVAPFAQGVTRLTGIGRLRTREQRASGSTESSRLASLCNSLRSLGCRVDEGEDFLEIHPVSLDSLKGGRLSAGGDPRLAMAFAILGLGIPGVEVLRVGCVCRADPEFFSRLLRLLD